MLLPFLVFVVVAGSVLGIYAAVTHVPGMLDRRRLDQRLHDVSNPAAADEGDDGLVMRPNEGPLPSVDRMMSGTRAGSWLEKLIDQSGCRTTPSAIVMMSLALGAIAGLAVGVLTQQWFLAPFAAVGAALLPFAYLRHRRSVRIKKFEEQFPEALDLMSRALRAGHAFQTAMGMAADELPPPVGPEFRKTFDQQNFGLPLREALNQMTDRVPILDVRFFVTAVLIQRETGGNLSEILDNLAHVVRERFKVLRQVRVHTAHGRFTAFVLLALPAVLGVVLNFLNPEHMELLFKDRIGQMLLVVSVIMQTIGFFWIRKVIRIEV